MEEYKTKQQLVTERLREVILRGELKPGSRLHQEQLAVEFGVSRVPIREALRELEAEGHVVTKAHRGTFVARLSIAEIEEIFAVRSLLEGMVSGLGAASLAEEDLNKMRALEREMRECAHDSSLWLDRNREFHSILYQASGRQIMCELIDTLRDRVEHYLRTYVGYLRRARHAHAEHARILKACERRDGSLVELNTKEHLHNVATTLIEYLKSIEAGADL